MTISLAEWSESMLRRLYEFCDDRSKQQGDERVMVSLAEWDEEFRLFVERKTE